MNRIALAVTLVLAAGLGCARGTSAAPAAATSAQDRGKVAAPVAIAAKMGATSARLTLQFAADSANVRVSVAGVDGLAVTSAPVLVEGGTFARGATAEYEVAYTPGAGRSLLAVTVSGTFGGSPRARVASFSIGEPTEAQKASAGTTVEQGGEAVKVMPSQPR